MIFRGTGQDHHLRVTKNIKFWHHKSTKKLSIVRNKKKHQLTPRHFKVHVPSEWSSIVFFNKKINMFVVYFFSPTYFFTFSVRAKQTRVFFDTNASVINFTSLYVNSFYPLYFNNLYESLNLFSGPLFKKLKFRGKGYYIYKNKRNTITPQFGYSHRLYLYAFFVSVKFLSKTSILLFGFSKADITSVAFGIKGMRPINIFTNRGVRFSRQVVYKKAGKISSYR